jgi:hypothetical protein
MNPIVKYLVRKPVQAVGGAIVGAIVCLVPGFIILGINDALAPTQPGSIGPLGSDWPNIIMGACIFGGIFGGAGIGLYL